jgi:hypothetical protein
MAALQEFPENFFEEETSDQRSILLAEKMNALGFSKNTLLCSLSIYERNHTILIIMTHFILFKFGINEFKYHQICLLRATGFLKGSEK